MVTLVPYTDADFEAMNRYFPQKEIHKYTNRGGYAVLSLSGIYKSYFMLLKENDTILGCGVIRRKYSREIRRYSWWLYDIWVEPTLRGKGYGTQLMQSLIDELQRREVEKVYLVVANDNIRAQNLYRKMGFTLYKQLPMDKILRVMV